MRDFLYKLVRTLQALYPGFADHKYAAQRWLRQRRGVPFERDFEALRYLPDDDHALFIDVGGNRGQSIDAILLTTGAGQVWSFEPNPVLVERLRGRYRGESRVRVFALGLGDRATVNTLHVPAYRGYLYDGLASFDRAEAVDWLPGRMYGYNEARLSVHTFDCETRRLDDLDCTPTFIKIDVQGFEYEVVAGARRTLERSDPVLLCENPSTTLIALLGDLGYDRYAFDGERFHRGVAGDLNDFFLRASAVDRLRAGGAVFA